MSDHKHVREFLERYCDEPSCEFFGKPWQQGVCFNADGNFVRTKLNVITSGREFSEELLQVKREQFADKPDEYLRYVEAMYETAMMNWCSTLDECIELRVENRRLKERLFTGGKD